MFTVLDFFYFAVKNDTIIYQYSTWHVWLDPSKQSLWYPWWLFWML